jgi:ketosteroid isomerase-like protein
MHRSLLGQELTTATDTSLQQHFGSLKATLAEWEQMSAEGGKRTLGRAPKVWHVSLGREASMIRLPIIVAALAVSSCSSQQPDVAATINDLRDLDAKLGQAIDAKDASAIAAFYADNAILMPTAEPVVRGKAAITEEWKHILAIPAFANESKLGGVEVASASDLAYTYGSYRSRLMGEDGKLVMEPGKWLTIWKKQPDGRWQIVLDTYNTDIPPPDHK